MKSLYIESVEGDERVLQCKALPGGQIMHSVIQLHLYMCIKLSIKISNLLHIVLKIIENSKFIQRPCQINRIRAHDKLLQLEGTFLQVIHRILTLGRKEQPMKLQTHASDAFYNANAETSSCWLVFQNFFLSEIMLLFYLTS